MFRSMECVCRCGMAAENQRAFVTRVHSADMARSRKSCGRFGRLKYVTCPITGWSKGRLHGDKVPERSGGCGDQRDRFSLRVGNRNRNNSCNELFRPARPSEQCGLKYDLTCLRLCCYLRIGESDGNWVTAMKLLQDEEHRTYLAMILLRLRLKRNQTRISSGTRISIVDVSISRYDSSVSPPSCICRELRYFRISFAFKIIPHVACWYHRRSEIRKILKREIENQFRSDSRSGNENK